MKAILSKHMNEEKQFYTIEEVFAMGFLPYKNIATLRRMASSGKIHTVRNPSPRSYMYVPAQEVARLRGVFTQEISGALETK